MSTRENMEHGLLASLLFAARLNSSQHVAVRRYNPVSFGETSQ